MLRAMKYELRPTKAQQEQIRRACGCCRLVYNTMLDRKIRAYKEDGTSLSAIELINQLPQLKEEFPFLKDAPSQALQQAVRNLDTAYRNFFRKGGTGFPRFKKKGVKDSFRIPVPCTLDFDKWTVRVAKIGTVRIYKGRNKPVSGTVRSYTISHTSTGRYYVSILYETADRQRLNNGKSVGIDLGIKDFAILSDGTVFESQIHLKRNLKRLRVLQRAVSRRYRKGRKRDEQSSNWKKAVRQVARLQERIAFQRHDYLHKVSAWVANTYSTVCVETLNVKGMMKNRRLSRSIADAGWGLFLNMLEYKCDNLVRIDRWFASSQTCSVCGHKEAAVKDISVREWTCPECGTRHDRDVNAAKNIEREGLSLCGHKVIGCDTPAPRTPRLQAWE